jgi:Na+/H+ antiporter NhaD/arsenite permease-like protein
LVKLFVVLVLFSWVFPCEEEKESLPSEEEEAAKETRLFSRSPSFVPLVFKVFATRSFFFFETAAGEDAQDVVDDDDTRDGNDDDLSSSSV